MGLRGVWAWIRVGGSRLLLRILSLWMSGRCVFCIWAFVLFFWSFGPLVFWDLVMGVEVTDGTVFDFRDISLLLVDERKL